LVFLAIVAAGVFYGREYVRRHPQDVPWTPLRLNDPIGFFTLRKIVALTDSPAKCRGLLAAAGSRDVAARSRLAPPSCGYQDGMRVVPASGEAALAPAGVVTSCPVAAAMFMFEEQVLQPAALRHFGSRVARIEHAGSYSCRRIYGRIEGPYSEHATADAIDILGFRLANGTRISVLRDWHEGGPKGAFLHDVRDGACRLFATTLSPDYNAAHSDHLHLDMAERGKFGVGVCR
jgi:hypothetical protein